MWAISLQEGGPSAWRVLLTPETRAKHWPLTGQLQLCSSDTVGFFPQQKYSLGLEKL